MNRRKYLVVREYSRASEAIPCTPNFIKASDKCVQIAFDYAQNDVLGQPMEKGAYYHT
ncbi:MAG: hypothetical protein LUD19_05060 [Clostridia bacterium]|nr:hypothetical protein [Clostridia bacterium]